MLPSSLRVLHGRGQGVIVSGESDNYSSSYTGEGVGRITPSAVKWCGAVYFTAGSPGKLQFLNNAVIVFKAEVDTEGNFSEKSWYWNRIIKKWSTKIGILT
jgi:hypothetical protein